MTSRITIVIDDDLLKKCRNKQAELLRKSTKSISLSSVINNAIRKGFK